MAIRRPRLWAGLALTGVWLAVALVVAIVGFSNDSRTVVIGAHTTTVSPTFDGYATLDFGPVLPRFRVASEQPLDLGVFIDVGDTQATNLNDVIRRDALIASSPDGEIRELRDAILDMAYDHAVRGAAVGLIAALVVAGLWRAIGHTRRAELVEEARRELHERERRPMMATGVIAAVLGLAVAAAVIPGSDSPEPAEGPAQWVTLPSLFPNETLDPQLNRIEVLTGGASRGGVELIDSAVSTYNDSLVFYRDLTDKAAQIGDLLREPVEGEQVALLIADRHDNIGMDSVARAVADAGHATLVIDAGDDTSTGGSWETFSVNSLADAFHGFPIVAIGGNHDYGGAIVEAYQDQGFTVLAGEPETVEGITFLGDSDVRASGLVAGRTTFGETVQQQASRLSDVACASDDASEDVSTVVVHSPTAGEVAADSGCVDLVLSGHVHRQIGPTTTYSLDGRPTTSYSNGTTGGAAYAFALGSALRRPAEVTLITYRDGRPIGLQPVGFTTDGDIRVGRWEYIAAGLPDQAPDGGPLQSQRTSGPAGQGASLGRHVKRLPREQPGRVERGQR